MKRIDIKQGKTIAYISQADLRTLYANKQFVKEELFQEKSILKGECNDEGYYPIEDEVNIRYIEGLAFIPHYNHLLKLGSAELSKMIDEAHEEYETMEHLLMVPCDTYVPLDDTQAAALKTVNGIDPKTVDVIQQANLTVEEEWLLVYDLAQFLRDQHTNYITSLFAMYDIKEEMEKQQQQIKPKAKTKTKTFGGFLRRFIAPNDF